MPSVISSTGYGLRIDALLTAETWAAFCAKYRIHPNMPLPGLPLEAQKQALRVAGALADTGEEK